MKVTEEAMIQHQKEVSLEVLNKLRILDKNPFLAGGAVRDWYFGKEAKDLDIFIQDQGSDSYFYTKRFVEDVLESEFKRLGPDDNILKIYESNPNISRVCQTKYNGCTIQLISTTQRDGIVKTFPFGICMAGMNHKGQMFYTKAFHQEVKYKSLVIRNPLYKDREKYVSKIQSYFPDWKFFKSTDDFLEYLTNE